MVRAARASITLVGAVALAACSSSGAPTASTTTALSSTSTSLSSGSSTPSGPLPRGCSVPPKDLRYSSGLATVEVTSGPGEGRFDLAVQRRSRSELVASSGGVKGEWKDASGKLLFVNLSGGDPCKPSPSAFVRIEPEGSSGPAFADSARNRCKVELKGLSAQGVDGSFTCTQLGGGGAGVFIDATGTFSLRV